MNKYVEGISLYETHRDLSTVEICVKSLKEELLVIQPLLDEIEQIKEAIKIGENIINEKS